MWPAEDHIRASRRVRAPRDPNKLWSWCLKRWGVERFSRLEYDVRSGRFATTHL